ncbi:unnamed protein product [Caenorhabditis nigoni]
MNRSKQNDLEIIEMFEVVKFALKFQKSIVQDLTFELDISQNSNFIFSKLINFFESLNRKFQTEILKISGTQESHFLSILPLIDPKTLEEIRIYPVGQTLHSATIPGIDQVFETEQWKSSKGVSFGFNATNLNLEHFRRFSKSVLHFETITAEKLNVLKEFYINSPNFELSYVVVEHFEETRSLSSAFGAQYEVQIYQNWYFRMKNNSKVLGIRCRHGQLLSIWFKCMEIGNVPEGAIIQD